MLAVVGYIIIIAMMIIIFKSKALPAACFAILPIIGAIICGFSIDEISGFISTGIGSTWQTAVLFVFSITYFGIMNDAGLFDRLVDGLIKVAGNNVTMIFVATVLIATIGHIDGAAATTYLITIPAMLPIYKRLKVEPVKLLLLCGAATGVMNLLPWGGPTVRAATTAGVDATELWVRMIPMQLFGLACILLLAVFMGVRETKRLKSAASDDNALIVSDSQAETEEDLSLKRPKLFIINLLLTIIVIVVLVKQWIPTYATFMVGAIIALMINYPDIKLQQKRIQAHAPSSIMLVITLLCAGIFLGIMTQTGMVVEMAKILIHAMPDSLQQYLHYAVGVLGAPLGMVLGPDPYYYAIMPLIGEIVAPFGVTLDTVGRAMLVGENVALSVSPVVPTTFLAIGLAGVELKEHIKYSFMPLWGLSVLMVIFAIIAGVI